MPFNCHLFALLRLNAAWWCIIVSFESRVIMSGELQGSDTLQV